MTSHGDSGIGFVTFGEFGSLDVEAPIETCGLGARGFNLYDGTLSEATFESITTNGDGAIGVQLSKPFGKITVNSDIRTKGSEGNSLARRKVVHLNAHALSLKPGTKRVSLIGKGHAVAEGDDIQNLGFEVSADVIGALEVAGEK